MLIVHENINKNTTTMLGLLNSHNDVHNLHANMQLFAYAMTNDSIIIIFRSSTGHHAREFV